ncbi:MAG: recombination mediator RecR [Candidatus Brocadiia bacterium]
MNVKNDSLNRLIQELARFPGLGEKSAERLAMHLFKMSEPDRNSFVQSILAIKNVRYCRQCFNFVTTNNGVQNTLCDICSDARRDQSIVCVVETHDDFRGMEKTGSFNGVYHILLGRIAPLEDCGPDRLTIGQLLNRIRQNVNIKELILGTNPTMEGDNTSLYIRQELPKALAPGRQLKITRLARGIPAGSTIGYINKSTLTDSLSGRQECDK